MNTTQKYNRMDKKISKILWDCARWGFFVCLGLSGYPQPVLAQTEQESQVARRIYIEGARFLQQKRYEEASVQFQLAYRLLSKEYQENNQPTRLLGALHKLQYFLGLCYFQLKNYKQAKKYLRLFLRSSSEEGERKVRAQQMLVESEKQIALMPQPRPRPRVTEPPPPPRTIVIEKRVGPPPMRWRPTPFVIMGLGIATLAVAGVMGALSNGAVQERDSKYKNLLDTNEPFSTPVADIHRKAETFAAVTNSLWIAGGVISATGVVLLFTVGRTPVEPPPPTAKISAGRQSLWFKGEVLE